MTIVPNAPETLSHFTQNAAEVVERLKRTGRPVVLTVDGEEELVVQDVRSYRKLAERAEEAEMYAFLDQSMKDHEEGRTRPAIEALDELARRHGLRVET